MASLESVLFLLGILYLEMARFLRRGFYISKLMLDW